MGILIIVLFVLLLVVLVFLGYKLLRYVVKNKQRTVVALTLCGVVVLIVGINTVFFKKMQFIQSKVYPDLYLVKNPVKDKKELHIAIKEFVIRQTKVNFENLEESIKAQAVSNYSLRFYEYNKSWGINLFADAGTAYFIENEEDPSGFVVEELSMYAAYRLAQFQMNLCENDSSFYCGELRYFDKGEVSKTEILNEISPIPSTIPVKK